MNFLAHLHLVRGHDDLMLGGLLGDFVRGRLALRGYPAGVRTGIKLHRRIDRFTDHSNEVKALRQLFPREFRRYAGIVLDLAFDHELAAHWAHYCDEPLDEFDLQVRELLARHTDMQPKGLQQFMAYADRRGLFAAYRDEDEMLFSLAGVGTRLSRANPLHRVSEIWGDIKAPCRAGFAAFYPRLQGEVDGLMKRISTMTGS